MSDNEGLFLFFRWFGWKTGWKTASMFTPRFPPQNLKLHNLYRCAYKLNFSNLAKYNHKYRKTDESHNALFCGGTKDESTLSLSPTSLTLWLCFGFHDTHATYLSETSDRIFKTYLCSALAEAWTKKHGALGFIWFLYLYSLACVYPNITMSSLIEDNWHKESLKRGAACLYEGVNYFLSYSDS